MKNSNNHFHELHTVYFDSMAIQYFYLRDGNDRNGNTRFRVYIIDPDANAIYENRFKCYEFEIAERVRAFVRGAMSC